MGVFLCQCGKHMLLVVLQFTQVVMNFYLFPVLRHIPFLSRHLLTPPVNRAYLCMKFGQLFFIKIELFVHSFLVSKLRGKKQQTNIQKMKMSYFA